MTDIKKKFIDILFEPDEEPEEEIVRPVKNKEKPEKTTSPIKAQDILYRKGGSVFIDYNAMQESPKKSEDKPLFEEPYELSSHISPIFGPIEDNSSKSETTIDGSGQTQIRKPADSHLDIITSPIYGYGKADDFDLEGYYGQEDESAEIHRLFEETDLYYQAKMDDDVLKEDEEISLFDIYGDKR